MARYYDELPTGHFYIKYHGDGEVIITKIANTK